MVETRINQAVLPDFTVSVEEISRSFPGVRALETVSLGIRAGECTHSFSEHHTGKSTLIKIFCRVIAQPDGGQLLSAGRDGIVRLAGRCATPWDRSILQKS